MKTNELQALAQSNIKGLVMRHAQDAAFYWMQRSSNTYSPLLTLERLAHFDGLLNAHLQGLRTAGDEGWQIALANLRRWRSAGECFVASVLALEHNEAARADSVWQILRQDPEAMLDGMVSALAWLRPEAAQRWIAAWLMPGATPMQQAASLRAVGLRRTLPDLSLMPFFDADEEEVRAAAAELAGRLRWRQYTLQVQALLKDESLSVRAAAAIAAPYLGLSASAALHQAALEYNALSQSQRGLRRDLSAEKALKLVRHWGMCLPHGDPAWMSGLQALPPRQMVLMLACHGNLACMPWLIDASQRPELARLCGWAISMLTGIDLEARGMSQAAPEEPEASEESERKRPVSDADAGLPWPHHAALQAWWRQQNAPQGRRVYGGAAEDAAHCLRVVSYAPQAARYAAANALALHHAQWPLFETRAASLEQQQELARLLQALAA
ncbi:hypothetical protein V8J88_06340 [Massilia sp. W12]|uniref:hypothetical protein n=1 Tax=Massilia sp. W12 TaxID=3126507 RepID=UPI0030D238B5